LSASDASAATRRYGRGAGILSVGIGITGLVTYGYFALASHNLSPAEYGGITLLWSAVFITVSILYRPVEQLLSRTIAERSERGQRLGGAMRIAATIQLALGVAFAAGALLARETIERELFSGSATLFWILFATVLAYAASYFARGFLAGSRRFGLYGLLVFLEATSRIAFALIVAVGLFEGQSIVALGILAAPTISLLVVPFAFRRAGGGVRVVSEEGAPHPDDFTFAHGGGFATAVLLVMVAEQTFLNVGPLLVKASADANGTALAGFAFNLLLVARAPLHLFQAISTSLLPHLTALQATGEGEHAFRHSVRTTLLAIVGFAALVIVTVLAAGPQLMQAAFGDSFAYERADLVIISAGMGLYLASVTLNQAALAEGRARVAATAWVACAAGFVVWNLLPIFDAITRMETGFTGAAAVLCTMLYAIYRR